MRCSISELVAGRFFIDKVLKARLLQSVDIVSGHPAITGRYSRLVLARPEALWCGGVLIMAGESSRQPGVGKG